MPTIQETESTFYCQGCGNANPADQDPANTRSCTACTHLESVWTEAEAQLQRALEPTIQEWRERWHARGLTDEIVNDLLALALEGLRP